MALTNTKKKIVAAVADRQLKLAEINRKIFDNPELCFKEFYATDLISGYLSENGFSVKKNVAGLKTAFSAERKGTGKGNGPTVAIIAEYDALPDIGHACGHSMIAASSSVAAVSLANAVPDFAGKLMVIGTPAEEGGGGKIKMIKKGVFENVDAAIMAHPSNKTRVVARMYAISDLEFVFSGKAAHAAAFPERGVNALDAGVAFYNSVSMLRQQVAETARIHGIFVNGGEAPNIIPEKVVMRFYVRALDMEYFEELKKRVIECAKGAARSTGCKVRVRVASPEYACFEPSYPIGKAFRENLSSVGIEDEGFTETEEIGSSDIGNLSQVVPTLHPDYAIGDRDDTNHSRKFLSAVMSKKGAKVMMAVTKAVAMTAYDLLTDKSLLQEAKKDFTIRQKRSKN